MFDETRGAQAEGSRRAVPDRRLGRSVRAQAMAIVVTWAYVLALHVGNDGLWSQGDAPRHAANGHFWWELLATAPRHPVDFALGYYARYPVINPVIYPPVFHVLEGAAFAALGASPYVAKSLVLLFALMAAFYMMGWLRRFVAQEAGWGGALLLLQPAMITWSHAIMLNVPSTALGLAALYHGRRWLEAPTSRHLYLAAGFGALGILTYYQTAIVVPVVLGWILVERRVAVLWDRRVAALGLLTALALLPAAWVVLQAQPVPLRSVYRHGDIRWAFYLEALPRLFGLVSLTLAAFGVLVGLREPRWRREVRIGLVWALVCYAGLSYLSYKDDRYILLVGPAIVGFGVVGLLAISRWGAARGGGEANRAFLVAMAALLLFHLATAPRVPVPRVEGYREIIAFIARVAPTGWTFYDGHHNGVFSFFSLVGDPERERGVVLGSKLLYRRTPAYMSRVDSAADVVALLRRECGCEWVAVERWPEEVGQARDAERYLREAVSGPAFRFVRAFPIGGERGAIRVDVYRLLDPGPRPDEVEVRIPGLKGETVFRVRPLWR